MIAEYRGARSTALPLPAEALSAFFDAWTPAPRGVETVALDAAVGRVLAADVRCEVDIPEYPRSAMDGFAVRASDLRYAQPAQPVRLPLAGEVRPGSRAELPERAALRIATGAPLPVGADSVVRCEDVFVDTDAVAFVAPLEAGTDVIAAGEDLAAGSTVAPAGTIVSSAIAGVLAALGRERVAVYRRPSALLISTGDEVVPIGASPRTGEVRDSNAVALAALLHSFGIEDVRTAYVADDPASLAQTVARGVETHELVVMSGGSSVGARDFTMAALAKHEPTRVVTHGVRMKPGRPVLLALSGSRPIIGLPGNPTAAMLALLTLGAPIVATLTGRPATGPLGRGIAVEPLDGKAGWDCYVPVHVDPDGGVRPVEHSCSTFVSSLVGADGYVHADAKRARVEPGELIPVYPLP
jgi:molybdopterin molybdotransferase